MTDKQPKSNPPLEDKLEEWRAFSERYYQYHVHRRRLSLPARCTVYAMVYMGFRHVDIAHAIGISKASVGQIARASCEGYYAKVRQEFERLGPDDFCRTYLYEDAKTRLLRLRLQANEPKATEEFLNNRDNYLDKENQED
jgi:hypothetical protein